MRKRQKCNSVVFPNLKTKRAVAEGIDSGLDFCVLERKGALSLGFRPIGPSVFDGARSKVALRGEGYAWAPIWWSYENSKR